MSESVVRLGQTNCVQSSDMLSGCMTSFVGIWLAFRGLLREDSRHIITSDKPVSSSKRDSNSMADDKFA